MYQVSFMLIKNVKMSIVMTNIISMTTKLVSVIRYYDNIARVNNI